MIVKEPKFKKITVIGSGYVGTTTAALLAHAGFHVVALDIDKHKVEMILNGKSPFYEIGLDTLISSAIAKKTLSATTNYEEAIADSDIIFSCVGTPDNPDGSSNLSYVFSAAESATPFFKKGAVFVQKSTVPVGTGRKVIPLLPKNVAYVSNPEFLREGTAVFDTLLFDRIVAGGNDNKSVEKVLDIYRQLESRNKQIAQIVPEIGNVFSDIKSHGGQYISTTLESAELIKVTANAFLALKISFANSIAKLCDETDADVVGVMDGIGTDTRIGRAFLNAGRGYGGGCFPKDVSGLISSALEHGVDLPIMTAATEINDSMAGYIVQKAEKFLGSFRQKNVAVLGLSFKAGTSDARKSPAVKIANLLAKEDASVICYDPEASEEAHPNLNRGVVIVEKLDEAIKDADVIFVATDWPEFKDPSIYRSLKKCKMIVDCMNCLDKDAFKSGVAYIGVGRNGD